MTLQKRLAKLEVTRGGRPNPDAAATFTALVEALDRLAGELLQGGEAETKARKELGNLMTDLHL